LTADACRDLVNSVSDGTATDAEYEAAAIIAAYAPHAQPETSSRDWRVLRRALEHFDGDIHEAHPYWRDLVRHHLAIGAYSS
jgi:hypothetical protein